MPTYCYRTSDGELVERSFRIGKAPRCVRLEDGRIAERSFRDELPTHVRGDTWPRKSQAMGVHLSQIDSETKRLGSMGIPTQFDDKTGAAILESPRHEKKLREALGLVPIE